MAAIRARSAPATTAPCSATPSRGDSMTEAVLVGLTTYPAAAGHGPHTPSEYIDAVARAGGVPVLLPHTAADDAGRWAQGWIQRLDALVLIGGGDIAPEHTGLAHDTLYGINPARDRTELALARAAVALHCPTLAICRGLQLLNVAHGGTLHPHLPDVVGELVAHRSAERSATPHPVNVAPDSTLAALLGETRIHAHSWHHQAAATLGQGLQAIAWADDGVVEALIMTDCPELLAVQWHPELTAGTDARQQALFDEIVRLGKQRRHRAGGCADSAHGEHP
ncbi:gamma-glutamyl-gamma-aminobutyrate hydrolase family protein [Aquitalea sp. S1-19]|nr:gamma-glutamyl-gamma-aminobutyrate hydrolase family protein [Aquitalea sp. S1-19]